MTQTIEWLFTDDNFRVVLQACRDTNNIRRTKGGIGWIDIDAGIAILENNKCVPDTMIVSHRTFLDLEIILNNIVFENPGLRVVHRPDFLDDIILLFAPEDKLYFRGCVNPNAFFCIQGASVKK